MQDIVDLADLAQNLARGTNITDLTNSLLIRDQSQGLREREIERERERAIVRLRMRMRMGVRMGMRMGKHVFFGVFLKTSEKNE